MANRRRGRGEGKIETRVLKDGTKRYRAVIGKDGKRTVGPWSRRKGDALPAAQRKQNGAAPDVTAPSFATASLRLLNSFQADGMAPTNLEQYKVTLEFFARTDLGATPIDRITKDDVTEALRVHASTGQTRRGNLTRLLAVLRRLGVHIAMENPKEPRKPKKMIGPDGHAAFVAYALSLPRTDALVLLLPFGCGHRRSEACAARHEDREGSSIWIARSLTVAGGVLHERSILKSDNSFALQPMPEYLHPLVGKPMTGYVLTGGPDPMDPDDMTDRTALLLEGTAWKGFLPQDLRRSYGNIVYRTTGDIFGTATMMRNTVEVCVREYMQVDDTLRQDVMRKVAEKLGGTA